MSRGTHRRRQPSALSADAVALWTVLLTVITVGLLVHVALHVGWRLAGRRKPLPANPIDTIAGLATGSLHWPAQASTVLAAATATLALLAGAVLLIVRRRRARSSRVDDTARWLGAGAEIHPISAPAVAAKAARFGLPDTACPGVPIGVAVAGGRPLYASWEDMSLHVWGARTGKTTTQAIPAIMAAPGPVLVTSNKRDVADATRGPRTSGGAVWVFDPQQIAGETPDSWWWNPLTYVTDEVRAVKLAGLFAAASRPAGARVDAFFDSAAKDLLAGLLLAAALDHRPITGVYTWLTRPWDDTAVGLLRTGGYPLTADQVAGVINAPDKQRGGVYGTAVQMASVLTNRAATAWVVQDGTGRTEFAPELFATSTDTLYLLSKEGAGSAGPLTSALTVAVIEAAEEHAARCRGGRLPVPLLGVLDEAANCARWPDLPDLYSHFGSRGICLMTILQSWSQGVDAWGESGMRKLWSVANVAVYGGGVKERDFLEALAALIGDYDKNTRSISHTGRARDRQVSEHLTRERIFDPADLAALPPGRAVVLASGARPTLIRTIPWWQGPHADAIRASLAAHEPAGARP